MTDLQIREVTLDDVDLLLSWRNDPLVRQASRFTDPLTREDFSSWLATRIASTDSSLFLVFDSQNEPLGQVRFDQKGTSAEVSIFLAPAIRGQGLGLSVLLAAQERFLATHSAVQLCAFVKTENVASHSLFRMARYRLESVTEAGSWYSSKGQVPVD